MRSKRSISSVESSASQNAIQVRGFSIMIVIAAFKKSLRVVASLAFAFSAVAETSTFDAAVAAYRGGNLPAAIELLRGEVTVQPKDAKARSLLALALIKKGDSEAAQVQLDILKQLTPEESRYIAPLEKVFRTITNQKAFRDELMKRLASLDGEGALEVIDKSELAQLQKGLLRYYVLVYSGRYDEAEKTLTACRTADGAAAASLDSLQSELNQQRAKAADLWGMVDVLLSGDQAIKKAPKASSGPVAEVRKELCPAGSGSCLGLGVLEMSATRLLAQYAAFALLLHAKVAETFQLQPLSDRSQDLRVWQAVMFLSYEDIEKAADSLLSRKGTIEVPTYYSGDQATLYLFVIDGRSKRFCTKSFWSTDYVRPVPQTFLNQCVAFDRVKSLKQDSGGFAKINDGVYVKGIAGLNVTVDRWPEYYEAGNKFKRLLLHLVNNSAVHRS